MEKKIVYSVFTDPGSRAVNGDSLAICQTEAESCFVLCDGRTEKASSLAAQVFEARFRRPHRTDGFLKEAFQAAQDALLAEKNTFGSLETTAAAVVTDHQYAYIGHVGDSRVYVFGEDRVLCRTIDHSIPQMLVRSGEISEEEIRNHPERDMLLRIMGAPWEGPMYELLPPISLKKCQGLLLCSDGFWELIREEDMCRLLKASSTPDQWLRQMVELVRKNGEGREMDSFSAVAVRFI